MRVANRLQVDTGIYELPVHLDPVQVSNGMTMWYWRLPESRGNRHTPVMTAEIEQVRAP